MIDISRVRSQCFPLEVHHQLAWWRKKPCRSFLTSLYCLVTHSERVANGRKRVGKYPPSTPVNTFPLGNVTYQWLHRWGKCTYPPPPVSHLLFSIMGMSWSNRHHNISNTIQTTNALSNFILNPLFYWNVILWGIHGSSCVYVASSWSKKSYSTSLLFL